MGGGPDVAEFVPRRPQRGQLGPVFEGKCPCTGQAARRRIGTATFLIRCRPLPTPVALAAQWRSPGGGGGGV